MKTVIILILVLYCTSCMTTEKERLSDLRKMNECAKNWVIDSIQLPKKVTVILFEKRLTASVTTYPSLIIGVTNENDTIASVDKNFLGDLNVGQTVTLSYDEWTEDDKMYLHPLPQVSKDRKRNNLYCQVKVLYLGKIGIDK